MDYCSRVTEQGVITGVPSSVCVVGCAFIMAVSVHQITKLKPKFGSFKTEGNEIETHKIAAMVF